MAFGFAHSELDAFGAEYAGSGKHCTALDDVPTTSPLRKSYATKATALREPLYLIYSGSRRL